MANRKITYTRLDSGAWGVKGPADLIKVGASVEVTRKGSARGETQTETIAAIVFTNGEITKAAVAPRMRKG